MPKIQLLELWYRIPFLHLLPICSISIFWVSFLHHDSGCFQFLTGSSIYHLRPFPRNGIFSQKRLFIFQGTDAQHAPPVFPECLPHSRRGLAAPLIVPILPPSRHIVKYFFCYIDITYMLYGRPLYYNSIMMGCPCVAYISGRSVFPYFI